MDKYQRYLMDVRNSYYGLAINEKLSNDKILIEDKIVLTQDDDITINDYTLYIANKSIATILAIIGEEEKTFSKELDPIYSSSMSGNQDRFFIDINFDNQLDGIKIVFKNNLANDLYLPISYVLTDKDKYYTKKEQEYKDSLIKAANINVSTGADLVNIYFQPCCDKYKYSEIQFFVPKEFVTVGGPYGPTQKPSTWSLIKKCKVNSEDFYLSITGLAYGEYSFVLTQFDASGNVILKTDYIEFSISQPDDNRSIGWVNVI